MLTCGFDRSKTTNALRMAAKEFCGCEYEVRYFGSCTEMTMAALSQMRLA